MRVDPNDDGRTINNLAMRGATLYERTLEASGGRRVEWAAAVDDQELAVALYEAAPYDMSVEAIATPRLSINLKAVRVCGGIGSGRVKPYAGRRYSLFFTPATADASWAKREPSRHLNIYFPQSMLEPTEAKQLATLRHDIPLLDVHVARIKPLIDTIEFSLRHPRSFTHEVALGVAHLLIAELTSENVRGRRPALGLRAVAAAKEYVMAHLATTIKVSDLASLTGLSTTQFSVSFHQIEGRTPHQYIMDQRVQECVRRLRCPGLSLGTIAADCGFASHQHMTTVVKQRTGCTPTQIRGESAVPGRRDDAVPADSGD